MLELVVVIAIIAILTGAILPRINLGGDKKLMRDETLRLAELLRRASDESVFKNQQLGVRFTEEGYRFLKLEGGNRKGKWVEFEDKVFKTREWADGLEIDVQIEGVGVVLNPADDDVKPDVEVRPHVMVLSNGEIMPDFRVTVDRGLLEDQWLVATGVEELIEFGKIEDDAL